MRSFIGLIAAVAVSSPASGQTVALHHGDVDPLSAGWTLSSFGSGITSGPILDGDVPAWFIQRPVDQTRHYTRAVGANDFTLMSQQGWAISAIVRIPAANQSIPSSRVFFMRSNGFGIHFGTRADGQPYVQLCTGIQGTATGSGVSPYLGPQYTLTSDPAAYHRYDLVYRVADGSADLFVDGVERLSNYTGYITPQQPGLVWFGGGAVDQVSEARYHHVELRIGNDLPIPAEPTSWGAVKALYHE